MLGLVTSKQLELQLVTRVVEEDNSLWEKNSKLLENKDCLEEDNKVVPAIAVKIHDLKWKGVFIVSTLMLDYVHIKLRSIWKRLGRLERYLVVASGNWWKRYWFWRKSCSLYVWKVPVFVLATVRWQHSCSGWRTVLQVCWMQCPRRVRSRTTMCFISFIDKARKKMEPISKVGPLA